MKILISLKFCIKSYNLGLKLNIDLSIFFITNQIEFNIKNLKDD